MFLLCLKELGQITSADYEGLVLKVFTQYMSIMRKLQKEYWLEPAGSHGVWGWMIITFCPFV